MALISCKDVSFAYEGKSVVEGLNFSVEKGDYLCVVGENGSGKSTLVKGILGFMTPSHGRILFEDGLQRQDIGYLPQRNDIQHDFPATSWEVVSSGIRSKRVFLSKSQKQQVVENMALLSIETLWKKSFQELSGGQRQRVLLARALCAAKRLLLLDEPVAGLDPMATRDMYQAVERLHQRGMTIVMISHDIQAARTFARHILHLDHATCFFGTEREYAASGQWQAFARG